jgi:hypothetical protein
MRLKPETLAAHQQRHHREHRTRPHAPDNHLRDDLEAQLELPDMPPPMTANRAKDLMKCKRCQQPCGYCHTSANMDFDPLGR